MLAYALHITVRPGHEQQALETLGAIERRSLRDAGCLQFTWFQHDADPYRFTLVEQWESQEHLDAHLAQDQSLWESFLPALADEPRSELLRQVVPLATKPSADEVLAFATSWFGAITAEAPVETLLGFLSPAGLRMDFPEGTLTSVEDVREWYATVMATFHEHTHDLEYLKVTPGDLAGAVDVDLAVIWKATTRADGSRSAFRGLQSWQVRRSFRTGRLEIVTYRVRSLEKVA
ncbi:hypothetical protein GCM10010430_60860 [Kitasatospora cystarginea]|uniref:ABM domain-containing protein n=1 Tax=Kitasatospora cystarginea TaxID=58350 RepID=A0ABN3EQX5_9ACTN